MNKKMELELKSDSKKHPLEKIVEKNADEIVRILREKGYEVLSPTQKSASIKIPGKASRESSKTQVIGFGGKGGVGKTTLAALSLRAITEVGTYSVLAVDSDPNTCLPEILGAENYETLGNLVEAYKGSRVPPRKFHQDFNSLLLRNEQESYDLLPMGRGEGRGCYCVVNSLLGSAFRRFVLEGNYSYDYVVVDCEAGIEHISRKTSSFLSDLIVVAEGSQASLDTIKNMRDVGEEVDIEIDNFYIVANRVEDEEALSKIGKLAEELEIEFLGNIPKDKGIKRLSLVGGSILGLPESSPAYLKVKEITAEIIS